ncbi:MAG: glycosyltransferase family 4 protein [Alphaproteobacteria bacterium]|nr:glycosyltransferase family 4 protein [Alphaproteobacteria bacterium]
MRPERALPTGPVAIVLKGYPRLSETFIAQELLGLQERGVAFRIISLRHPTDKVTHPVHAAISAPVDYLPEYLRDEPARVWRGWRIARHLPGYAAAFAAWRRDLARDPTPNRGRRFGQACVLAAELGAEYRSLYAHFLHTPASVTRYAAIMRGLPWSVSAHAKDIWTTPDWEKREKLAEMSWCVTCTAIGRDHLAGLAPSDDRVALLYHGLDTRDFPLPPQRPAKDGSDPMDPVVLVSIGRAVEKKGYDVLLDALALLPKALSWRLVHIGGGELKRELSDHAERLGLSGSVDWRGARPRSEVVSALQEGDLFVLASRVAASGDRDGLPNVLMEAQAMALPVLSTDVSAIPELVTDGHTGLLVPPQDSAALAASLERLICNPTERLRLGAAGRVRVLSEFGPETGIDDLAARFGVQADARAA